MCDDSKWISRRASDIALETRQKGDDDEHTKHFLLFVSTNYSFVDALGDLILYDGVGKAETDEKLILYVDVVLTLQDRIDICLVYALLVVVALDKTRAPLCC